MQIVVALNGSRERNLTLSPGDDVSINLVVYANDGDANPVAVTDAQISTGGGGYLPIGTQFAIPYSMGRTPYRIIGKVAGISSTLVYGYIEAVGPGKLYWGYWDGEAIFPPIIPTTQAANVIVSDSAGNFVATNVEDVLIELDSKDDQLQAQANGLQTQINNLVATGGGGGGGGGAGVSSVNGRSGAVSLNKNDVGLAQADNTSDLQKPISTATQTALNGKHVAFAGQSGGTTLGTTGTIAALNFTGKAVASRVGDTLNVNVAQDAVSSVAGRTGAVTISKADVGLGNADNTSDANKPISTATQQALDAKHVAFSIQNAGSSLGTAGTVDTINFASGASVSRSGNVATINITGGGGGGGSGEVNTASNLGTGTGLFAQKNGVDLQFKSLKVTGNASISATTTEVTVNVPNTSAPVTSVAGRTGDVTLTKTDVGLGNVDNTSDASKPVSTAQAAAIQDARKFTPFNVTTPTATLNLSVGYNVVRINYNGACTVTLNVPDGGWYVVNRESGTGTVTVN